MLKAIILNHFTIGYEGKAPHLLTSYKDFLTTNELVTVEFCQKYHPSRLEIGVPDSYIEGEIFYGIN